MAAELSADIPFSVDEHARNFPSQRVTSERADQVPEKTWTCLDIVLF